MENAGRMAGAIRLENQCQGAHKSLINKEMNEDVEFL
jgi:hypothetical protein